MRIYLIPNIHKTVVHHLNIDFCSFFSIRMYKILISILIPIPMKLKLGTKIYSSEMGELFTSVFIKSNLYTLDQIKGKIISLQRIIVQVFGVSQANLQNTHNFLELVFFFLCFNFFAFFVLKMLPFSLIFS